MTLLLETIRAQQAALVALHDRRPATTGTLADARAAVDADEAIIFHDSHTTH